jgi:hypothetical protein
MPNEPDRILAQGRLYLEAYAQQSDYGQALLDYLRGLEEANRIMARSLGWITAQAERLPQLDGEQPVYNWNRHNAT